MGAIEITILDANTDSKEVIFKTANLDTLNFLKEFNRVVGPLIPKEEEVSGKVAGKLAGKSKVGAGKQGKTRFQLVCNLVKTRFKLKT